ncbi:hypothetical protein B6I21_03235 [candidate division KSB1 bacterium 4572_119]|nr:MAG: hypothetical protein B6I21_03235 [candidate division KSB1 bacterium 4572_119]
MKMKKNHFKLLLVLFALLIWNIQFAGASPKYSEENNEECTIGVASGKATSDGRPLIWKTRDTSSRDNEIKYNTSYKYKFVSVINAGGTLAWMGVNEKGFAILNSNSSDLESGSSGPGNGTLMKIVLGNCGTVLDFTNFLDSTNVTGRQTAANFAVIDSTGAAAIFETAGYEYWKFDANDSTIAPNGYVLRTNFAFNGAARDGLHDGLYSIERYRRQRDLMSDFYAGDTLNYHSIIRYQMRDFSDFNSEPVPVPFPDRWLSYRPFGYIYAGVSICRSSTASTSVIQGVLPGESSLLSILWTILGQPAAGIAVPYFPVGNAPSAANGPDTAPLCDISGDIRSLLFDYAENSHYIDSYKLRNEDGFGLWANIFPAEDSIFTIAEENLSRWRSTGFSVSEILATETSLAQYALQTLNNEYDRMITAVEEELIPVLSPNEFVLAQNYPNPFNAATTIGFYLPASSFITLKIYNLLGEEVATPISGAMEAGSHVAEISGMNLATGIYFYRLEAHTLNSERVLLFRNTKKFQYIK